MSEFFKDYKSCKDFKFKVSNKKDIERVLRYFQAKDYTPIPKDLLVEAK
jgi:DNA polymerase III delta prime subunit